MNTEDMDYYEYEESKKRFTPKKIISFIFKLIAFIIIAGTFALILGRIQLMKLPKSMKGLTWTDSIVEAFENGELQEREFRGTDGVYEGMAYYTNGKLERLKRETPEGYYEEQRREDGKLVYMKLADAGMTNVREAFYTEGKPVKVIIDGVVHEDWETLSQFG